MTEKTLPELLAPCVSNMRGNRAILFSRLAACRTEERTSYVIAWKGSLCFDPSAARSGVVFAHAAPLMTRTEAYRLLARGIRNGAGFEPEAVPAERAFAEALDAICASIAFMELQLCQCQSLGG